MATSLAQNSSKWHLVTDTFSNSLHINPKHSFITMPKEKSTRKAKAVGGKKKKGTSFSSPSQPRPWSLTPSDPNAPKRGLSAYMFFANEQRENVREETPGISFGA